MTNPVELILLASKIKRRTRDAEILALCEGAEKHLANRVANSQPVANTVANSVANMANKPTAPKLDRRDYMREYMRKCASTAPRDSSMAGQPPRFPELGNAQLTGRSSFPGACEGSSSRGHR
jgi:hypothetical protein